MRVEIAWQSPCRSFRSMVRQLQSFALVLAVLLPLIEALGYVSDEGVRVRTKGEIMSGMTTRSALSLVLSLNQTRANPEMASLIQDASQVGQHGHVRQHGADTTSLRGVSRKEDALTKAVDMLNNMSKAAIEARDLEERRCAKYEEDTTNEMSELQNQIRNHNADAASARAKVIIASGNIMTLEITKRDTEVAFEKHKEECKRELQAMRDELEIVENDILVMADIIGLIDCSADGSASLMQDPIHTALGKLKSETAKELVGLNQVKGNLSETEDPIQSSIMDEIRAMPVGGVNVSDVPVMPVVPSCQDGPCRITGGGCQRLKDRFIVVNVGITDRKVELETDIGQKDAYCTRETATFETQISNMLDSLAKEKGDLGEATSTQNRNEAASHEKAKQHEDTATQFRIEMTKCCDNINAEKGTECALKKIRDKVKDLKGDDSGIYFVDCETTEWSDEACSVTCGGGTMRRTRRVIVNAQGGGVPCPALEALEKCNEFPCPVDCEMTDWEPWSACTAECNGGVKEKTRTIARRESDGGVPCEDTEAEIQCNVMACDAPCVLSDWSEWTPCSKMCGTGSQRRTKGVKIPAIGDGGCAGAESDERRQFRDCNDFSCARFLNPPRTELKCATDTDVIILMDGSRSLELDGWLTAANFTGRLIEALAGDDEVKTRVALMLFSGPSTWDDYQACTGIKGTVNDMKAQCGLDWISRFEDAQTTEEINALGKRVGGWGEDNWPAATTLTSAAIGEAESLLLHARDNVTTKVVVLTDGRPMSPPSTIQAARQLEAQCDTIWLGMGKASPTKLIKKMAPAPEQDHIFDIPFIDQLRNPESINNLVASICARIA